jgi:hypothetical protein
MKTTTSKNGKRITEKRYDISVKAYNDFTSRIRSVLATDKIACEQVLQLLEASVGQGDKTINIDDCSIKAQIAFSMIKPEIEKAIKRSKTARERAGRKKATAHAEATTATPPLTMPEKEKTEQDNAANNLTPSSPEVEATPEVEAAPESTPHLSRRERRKRNWREFRLRKKAAKREIREQREKQMQQ